eukprot:135358_1
MSLLICFLIVHVVKCIDSQPASCMKYHPVINELQDFVNNNPQFAIKLNNTFNEAGRGPNSSEPVYYHDMYSFFNSVLTVVPSKTNVFDIPHMIFPFLSTETGNSLLKHSKVNVWIKKWLNTWKDFLDSYESAVDLSTWTESTNMSNFVIPENGYQSFNQFFTRNIKPGTRPISSYANASIIVSPVDGQIVYIARDITIANRFTVKNIEINLIEILGDKEQAMTYENGTLILITLWFHDYHHYHSYCNNAIIEQISRIGGYYFSLGVWNSKIWNNCSGLEGLGCYPFWTHVNNRAIIRMKCNHGQNDTYNTAFVVVGLGHISSVNMVIKPSMNVISKGTELGYFQYGGSTVALIFPPKIIDQILVQSAQTIQMGQPLAIVK